MFSLKLRVISSFSPLSKVKLNCSDLLLPDNKFLLLAQFLLSISPPLPYLNHIFDHFLSSLLFYLPEALLHPHIPDVRIHVHLANYSACHLAVSLLNPPLKSSPQISSSMCIGMQGCETVREAGCLSIVKEVR